MSHWSLPLKTKSASRGIKRIDLAYVQVASSESARDINRDIVLEIIRSKQPVSRADVARLSGLQRSTVSAIVEQLIDELWVTEGAVARLPRGRRPTLLSLNDQLVILVADVHPEYATVALVDLNERFLAREVIPLVSDPSRAVDRIVRCMQHMRDLYADRSFEGVGLSMPGRIDPQTQRLILAPNLKWGDFDVKKAFEQKMKMQVELANAANASLLAELWSGRLDGVRNAVLLTISEGLGAAIFANGQIVTSLSGLAGEFGHAPLDPAGPACGCGQQGCWEVFAASSAALRHYAESAVEEVTAQNQYPSIQTLLLMAEEGDARATDAITRQCEALGRGMRLVTTTLAPEVILIAGDLNPFWDRFGPVVQAALERSMLAGKAPKLIITRDGELAGLRGAAAVVLQRHTSQHREAGKPRRRQRNELAAVAG